MKSVAQLPISRGRYGAEHLTDVPGLIPEYFSLRQRWRQEHSGIRPFGVNVPKTKMKFEN
jgi:hypothetical protein